MVNFMMNYKRLGKFIWNSLRSPRAVAILKLGIATVGVIHAIEELKDSSKSGKNQIGFKSRDDD